MVVITYKKTPSLTQVDYILSLFIHVGHYDFSLYITLLFPVSKFYRI